MLWTGGWRIARGRIPARWRVLSTVQSLPGTRNGTIFSGAGDDAFFQACYRVSSQVQITGDVAYSMLMFLGICVDMRQ